MRVIWRTMTVTGTAESAGPPDSYRRVFIEDQRIELNADGLVCLIIEYSLSFD